jgi:hypothetical protein
MIPKREEWVKARDGAGGKVNLVSGVSVGDLLAAVHKKRATLPLDKALQASAKETKALADGLRKYKAAPAVKKNAKLVAVVDRLLKGIAGEPEQLRKMAEERHEKAARERRRAEEQAVEEKRRAEEHKAKEKQDAAKKNVAEQYTDAIQLLNQIARLCKSAQGSEPEAYNMAVMTVVPAVSQPLENLAKLDLADAHDKALALWRQDAPGSGSADELPPRLVKRAAGELGELTAKVLALLESAPPPK